MVVVMNIENISTGYDSSAEYFETPNSIGLNAANIPALINILRAGLPVATVEQLRKDINISLQEMGQLIDVSPRTLTRRKKEGRLHTDESERVYRLSVLLALAEDVLEGHAAALRWLKSPKKALDGQTPLEYADTEVGINEVKELLNRIEYGIFS